MSLAMVVTETRQGSVKCGNDQKTSKHWS